MAVCPGAEAVVAPCGTHDPIQWARPVGRSHAGCSWVFLRNLLSRACFVVLHPGDAIVVAGKSQVRDLWLQGVGSWEKPVSEIT